MFAVEKNVKHKLPKFLQESNEDFYRYTELNENSMVFMLEYNTKVSDCVSYHRMMYYQIDDLIKMMSNLTKYSIYVLTPGIPMMHGNIQLEEISKILKDSTGRYYIFCHNHKNNIACSEYFSSDFDKTFEDTEVVFNKYQP